MPRLLVGFLCVFLLSTALLSGQTPQGISYQAALRLPNGQVMANTDITVRFSVLTGSDSGPIEWQETHNTTTSGFGMFTLTIGQGQNTGLGSAADFSNVDWASGNVFLKVEAAGPNGVYELIGTSQMLTVPYAFHAATADNINDADADPTNELIESLSAEGTELHITEAGITHTVDLAFLQDDADANPANELIVSLLLNEANVLKIEEGGTSHNLDLSALVNDADANPANELISEVSLQNNNTLSITEAGLTHTGDLSGLTNDADADPANESLTQIALQGNVLQITESGQDFSVDLTSLTENQFWIQNGTAIFNDSEKVGINTQLPTSDFHLNGSLSVAFRKVDNSAAQFLLPNDNVLLCDVTSGTVILNLPSAATCTGRLYTIRKLSVNLPPLTNQVIINANIGDLIENSGSIAMQDFFPEVLTLLSDGAKWWVLSKQIIQ